ncbi:MAG: DUF3179 domain-containing protein [Ekhidna sp.]|nr:DUF3179 domain-containing protein [Ekhidna sp.]
MKKLIALVGLFVVISCSDQPEIQRTESEWLIAQERVFDGGPGPDGIPALTDTEVATVGSSQLSYLSNEDLVIVYTDGTEIKAYPHRILDWHEIANEQIGNDFVAVTYCPLTGTGVGWGRELNGTLTTFGVSGLLYETNIMPFDRLTNSYWNQMFNSCVNGELIGTVPEFFNVLQMSYGALQALYPEAQVATENTGFSRDYGRYPYGSYLTNSQTIFPVSNFDTSIHPKEFVRGVVVGNQSAAFRFPESGRSLKQMTMDGSEVVVVADRDNDFIVSYLSREISGEKLELSLIEDPNSPNVMEDQFGNTWNAFGKATSGPNTGDQLEAPYSYMGFWFAWHNFYPDILLVD